MVGLEINAEKTSICSSLINRMHGKITTLKTVNKSVHNIVTTWIQGSWVPSPVRRLKRGWSVSLVSKQSPELADFRSDTLKSATYLDISHTPLLSSPSSQKTEGLQNSLPQLAARQNTRDGMCCMLAVRGAACGQWATQYPWTLQYHKVHIFWSDTNKSKLHACRN
jgi:hypothetical protein